MRVRAMLATGVAVLLGTLAACSPGPQASSAPPSVAGPEIAVLFPDSRSSGRWDTADRIFMQQAFEAAGLTPSDYVIHNAAGDPAIQRSQAETAIRQGAKVIVLVSLDNPTGVTIIDEARAKGVKVIDYDNVTVGGKADYYVGNDVVAAGRLLGQGLVADLKKIKKPRVAILDGDPSDAFSAGLAKGYNSVLQPLFASKRYVKLDQQPVTGGDPDTAQTVFDQMLAASGNKVDGVLTPSDSMAAAVISSLRLRHFSFIPVTGLGGGVAALQRILAEEQALTVYFSYHDIATKGADLAVQVLRGQKPTEVKTTVANAGRNVPALLVPPVLVKKSTIESTVLADGLVTWDDLCTEPYIEFCPK